MISVLLFCTIATLFSVFMVYDAYKNGPELAVYLQSMLLLVQIVNLMFYINHICSK